MLLRQAFYEYGTNFKDVSVPFVTSQTFHILYYQLEVKNTLLSVNVSVITNMSTSPLTVAAPSLLLLHTGHFLLPAPHLPTGLIT